MYNAGNISAEQRALGRLSTFKKSNNTVGSPLGPELISFFQKSVQKRQTKLGKIAERWAILVPEMLAEHCALEAFTRGVLTVLVDSPSHLYELKQVLLAGLQGQILLACKSTGLRKINLRLGRWYECDGDDTRKKLKF